MWNLLSPEGSSMRLYIVRHGEAERQLSTDAARALTVRGAEEVSALWTVLSARGIAPTRLINSPFVRARQTADLIAQRFPDVPREEWSVITPEGEPAQVIAELDRQGMADGWMLVSHMPLVDLLCGALTGGERCPFPVGSVACVELEAPLAAAGRLLWLQAPADVR
jgi:phosphohistidine phosphatase